MVIFSMALHTHDIEQKNVIYFGQQLISADHLFAL
jgi:hypothetical protein